MKTARCVLVLAACSGGSAPQPTTVSNTAAPAAPDAAVPTGNPPDMTGNRACEPIVTCGVWSPCVWLEHVDEQHYRAGGATFVRRRECYTGADGKESCAVHCTGPNNTPPCYDGLHPIDEVCTGASVPAPSTANCRLGDGICGSLL